MYDDFLLNDNINNIGNKANKNLTQLDTMFDTLSDDIESFNKFISDINKQKKENSDEWNELNLERQRVNKTKIDFELYVKTKNEEFEKKEQQVQEYLESQKKNLVKAEEDFKNNMQSSLSELEIKKQEVELQKQQIKEEKEQFENYKDIEINKIHHSQEILNSEKEQFEKYKEINIQKIDLETKNLEQKYGKLKEIIEKFNSQFKPILDDDKE